MTGCAMVAKAGLVLNLWSDKSGHYAYPHKAYAGRLPPPMTLEELYDFWLMTGAYDQYDHDCWAMTVRRG